jgi:hypothetical protein
MRPNRWILAGLLAGPGLAAGRPVQPNGVALDSVSSRPEAAWAEAALSHERNLRWHHGAIPSSRAAGGCADVGNVAVIANDGNLVLPPRPPQPFDLPEPATLVLDPVGDGYAVSLAPPAFVAPVSPPIPVFGDDDVLAQATFPFTLFGATYTSLYVNANGNVTFDTGDSDWLALATHLVGGPPRVAPLFLDLSPQRTLDPGLTQPAVHLDVLADRAVVSWIHVPEFGTDNFYTFQVTLHGGASVTPGRIELSYAEVAATPPETAVIGVAAGGGAGPWSEIDFANDAPATLPGGAIFQELHSGTFTIIDRWQIAREFYRCGHGDKYDQLVVFTDFPNSTSGSLANHSPVRNETSGIGVPIFDMSAEHGSAGELESMIFMNDIAIGWSRVGDMLDPPVVTRRYTDPFSGPPAEFVQWLYTAKLDRDSVLGNDNVFFYITSFIGVLSHETSHRWLVYARFRDGRGACAPDVAAEPSRCYELDLLGRDLGHWSVLFNARTENTPGFVPYNYSNLEGSAWIDCRDEPSVCAAAMRAELQPSDPRPRCAPGKRLFLSAVRERGDGFAPLDLYLMGLLGAADVGPFWYIDQPSPSFGDLSFDLKALIRGQWSHEGWFGCGVRIDLTVDALIAHPAMGPRESPASRAGYAYGDEVDTDVDPGGDPVPGEVWSDATDARGNPDVKTQAYVLIVDGTPLDIAGHGRAIEHVDTARRTLQWYLNGPATGGRGRFNTSLRPARW